MKRSRGTFWLYFRVAVLDLAVAGMFYTVSQTVPLPPISYVSVPTHLVVKPQLKPIESGIPTELVISSLGMDLPVDIGSYNPSTGDWTPIDNNKAYYADVSVPSNDHNGTTLIYGHAQEPAFGVLHDIEPQAEAVVYSDTGYRFHYIYQSMRQVVPTDVSIFPVDSKPLLVLQTCSGGWDNYRSLFTFTLKSVDKV